MPLIKWKKNIGKNITELKKDNEKKGKEKGANGTPRSMAQIKAIALSTAKVKKEPKSESKRDKGYKENKIEKNEYRRKK